jgi:hypothetical protein
MAAVIGDRRSSVARHRRRRRHRSCAAAHRFVGEAGEATPCRWAERAGIFGSQSCGTRPLKLAWILIVVFLVLVAGDVGAMFFMNIGPFAEADGADDSSKAGDGDGDDDEGGASG